MVRKSWKSAVHVALWAFTAVALTGCGAGKLDQLQDQYKTALIGLATANAKAAGGGDPSTDQRHTFELEFADIAKQATQEAGQAGDPRTAIGFYLVAALSAWQAGAEGQNLLLDIIDKGGHACDQLKNSPTRPPRDCAQIVIVPSLAINDQLYGEINQLRTQKNNHAISDEELGATEKRLLADTRQNFRRLADFKAMIDASAGISPAYVAYYEDQKFVLYCNHFAVASMVVDKPLSDPSVLAGAAKMRAALAKPFQSKVCQKMPDRR